GPAESSTAPGAATREAPGTSQHAQPLQAHGYGEHRKRVQGATVTFSIATGTTGASASFLGGSAQTTATTKSDGQATSPPLVANASSGRFTAAASTTDLATPATFSLTNHAAANTLATIDTAPQAAAVGTRYLRPLRARVLDPNGQPIEGITVTFTLPQASTGAGASFLGGSNQATALTDASGRASSPALLANAAARRIAATGTATGSATPRSYPLRNVAGRLTATDAAQQAAGGPRYPHPLQAPVGEPN